MFTDHVFFCVVVRSDSTATQRRRYRHNDVDDDDDDDDDDDFLGAFLQFQSIEINVNDVREKLTIITGYNH
jgi:hypothetical protein